MKIKMNLYEALSIIYDLAEQNALTDKMSREELKDFKDEIARQQKALDVVYVYMEENKNRACFVEMR